MKVLHIASYFSGSRLYVNLISHIEALGIEQIVYSPVRTENEARYNPDSIQGVPKSIRHVLKPYHRIFYRRKIQIVYQDLSGQIDLSGIGLIHAHTLYSDGGVALRLRKKHQIPYLVAVRNTDLNLFAKFRPDLLRMRNRILENARRIVVLSPAYADRLERLIGHKRSGRIMPKVTVVPNGIDAQWFDAPARVPTASYPKRLLYVGKFTRDKNVLRLIEATATLAKQIPLRLTIVGGTGAQENAVLHKIRSGRYPFLTYVGPIDDSDELRQLYREHDIYVMPSKHESFGLTYIEALSQGLPILYSRREGVDGYFADTSVGQAANPNSTTNITAKLRLLLSGDGTNSARCRIEATRFQWPAIAQEYERIYRRVQRSSQAE